MPIETFFTYHLKAHTISNKLVSKVFAQKKGGGESYDSSNMWSNFGGFRCSPPKSHYTVSDTKLWCVKKFVCSCQSTDIQPQELDILSRIASKH